MTKKAILILLLALLAACAPSTQYLPPNTPIVYPTTPYRTLFDATLQELTAAYVPDALDRRTFSITRADLETGLITAVRNERRESTTLLRYRFPYDGDEAYDTWPFPSINLTVPVPNTTPAQTIITIVVRPEGQGASLIYSTQGPSGTNSTDATRLMRAVTARLDARFNPQPVNEPVTQPLEQP